MGRRKKHDRSKHSPRVSSWWGGLDETRKSSIKRSVAWTFVMVALLAAGAIGLKAMEASVLTGASQVTLRAVRVKFVDRPQWIPTELLRWIAADIAPSQNEYHRRDMSELVFSRAQANAWIRKVHRVEKRRTEDPQVGLIEVHAEFRKPIARVLAEDRHFYVDADAVRLPALQAPKWTAATAPDASGRQGRICFIDASDVPQTLRARPIHYIVIDGVRKSPPSVGQAWRADDLAAGLKLVRLVLGRPYAGQVTVVDVRNHAQRINKEEPALRIYAQRGKGRPTDIYFGRFPTEGGGDYVVSPQRKMSYLDRYVADHNGELAGHNSYLDRRFDALHVSLN